MSTAEDVLLKSAGCKTEYFLLQDLSQAYADKTGTRIQLGNTGNKKAVNLLLDNNIDFAFTCKPVDILAEKLKLDPDVVRKWKSVPVAKDPIVVVANEAGGVDNVTTDQLTGLFGGDVRNWQEIGGNDLPVKLAYLNPQLESGINLLFKEFTIGADGRLADADLLANGPSMAGNYVTVTPGAVTFMGYNSYQEKFGTILKVNGVYPSRENILDGSYGLTATYYLTLDGAENSQVSQFIDFSLSEEGKKAIEKNFIFYTE